MFSDQSYLLKIKRTKTFTDKTKPKRKSKYENHVAKKRKNYMINLCTRYQCEMFRCVFISHLFPFIQKAMCVYDYVEKSNRKS